MNKGELIDIIHAASEIANDAIDATHVLPDGRVIELRALTGDEVKIAFQEILRHLLAVKRGQDECRS